MSDLYTLIPLILAGLGGLAAWFFKGQADRAKAGSIVSETKVQDAPLAAQQAQDEAKIREVDAGIQQIKDERERLRNQYISDQERANSWNNKPKP